MGDLKKVLKKKGWPLSPKTIKKRGIIDYDKNSTQIIFIMKIIMEYKFPCRWKEPVYWYNNGKVVQQLYILKKTHWMSVF